MPSSPYIKLVYAYADTMLDHGRDTYGPQKTGLFLSALDRTTLQPLTNRPMAGANPQRDQNLLRLLYTLSELSAKPRYREAADAELKWFLENPPSSKTPYSDSWDVLNDSWTAQTNSQHFFRPWMLWERCFQVAPEPSKLAALQFAQDAMGESPTNSESKVGYCLRTWSVAYAKTKDDRFLKAIEELLKEIDKTRVSAATPSLAIDCDGAAHHLPNALAARLRSLAAQQDELFCSRGHNVKQTGGFITNEQYSQRIVRWTDERGGFTTAQIGMMCVSRYENTGKISYRKLITEAADAYLDSLPEANVDAWPGTFGQAISLELAAWRHTADVKYFASARKLADFAIEKFLDKSPLPRASLKSEHYESITGADTLMLALLELHLNVLHITAVRCPPNTIDR